MSVLQMLVSITRESKSQIKDPCNRWRVHVCPKNCGVHNAAATVVAPDRCCPPESTHSTSAIWSRNSCSCGQSASVCPSPAQAHMDTCLEAPSTREGVLVVVPLNRHSLIGQPVRTVDASNDTRLHKFASRQMYSHWPAIGAADAHESTPTHAHTRSPCYNAHVLRRSASR